MKQNRISDELLLTLIDQIYAAALEPRKWSLFLRTFASAVRAQGTLIFSHNVETMEASTDESVDAPNASVNFDPAYVRSLAEYYNYVNVWAHNHEVLKPGRAVTGSMLYPVRDLPKTEFYGDWLRPQNLFHALGGLIVQDGAWSTKFSALRSRRAGDYTADEIRLYKLLLPHLARAAQLQRRYTFLHSVADTSLAALDTVSEAILLLDERGRVLHVNSVGETELRRTDPLFLHATGEVQARGVSSANFLLKSVIAAALDPFNAARRGRELHVQLSRRNGEKIFVQALPLSRAGCTTKVSPMRRVAACALVVRPCDPRAQRIGPQILRHVYGLTPSEVEVVLAIAEGETIRSYAERRGISRHTAANQLKRAFEKTGIRRQSEMVAWITQGCRPGTRSAIRAEATRS